MSGEGQALGKYTILAEIGRGGRGPLNAQKMVEDLEGLHALHALRALRALRAFRVHPCPKFIIARMTDATDHLLSEV